MALRAIDWIIPVLLLLVLAAGAWKRVPVYGTFVRGAEDGLHLALRILPGLVAVLVMVEVMRASGMLDALAGIMVPIMDAVGVSGDIAPLVVVRPLSGSASVAMLQDILMRFGPDSRAGMTASAILGSSETVFYTASLYCAAAGVKRTRYLIPAALLAQLACILAAGWVVRWMGL